MMGWLSGFMNQRAAAINRKFELQAAKHAKMVKRKEAAIRWAMKQQAITDDCTKARPENE